jgi:Xaa-Pro aminopeptidase
MNELPIPLKTVFAASPAEARLGALRGALAQADLHGFLVPRADEHQGEYVPKAAERLHFLTGFTGSAGLAIVLSERAAVFVDGRYTLQVEAEVDRRLYEICHLSKTPPWDWLAEAAKRGQRIAYDPWLHTPDGLARLKAAAAKAGATLVPAPNAVDAIWGDRPAPPAAPVVPHGAEFAGQPSAEKRAALAKKLAADGIAAAVITLPDSVAWLLNVRGGDVSHSPLPLSFAILKRDGSVDWFLDPRKATPELGPHLGAEVRVRAPREFAEALAAFKSEKVQADPATASSWIFDRLEEAGAVIVREADPCLLPKSCKNDVELQGIRAAHRRDGAALTKFLGWVGRAAPKGGLREIAAADRLEAFRRQSNLFRDLSFHTISGSGPNGAIVHYRANEKSDRELKSGELYLVDSGGQYPDGTTDVTRTVAIGTPTAEMKKHFTLVLKGHIALATARFPAGTSGSQLDALARLALWREGLDYDHGTGHGVGHYLCVHEGPQRISKLPNTVALKPGMVVSNEPGYYRTGAYGIRIENLVVVTPAESVPDGDRPMLGFETLTLAPIDRRLIDLPLLSPAEIAWLDAYHARLAPALDRLLADDDRRWLAQAAAPLAE